MISDTPARWPTAPTCPHRLDPAGIELGRSVDLPRAARRTPHALAHIRDGILARQRKGARVQVALAVSADVIGGAAVDSPSAADYYFQAEQKRTYLAGSAGRVSVRVGLTYGCYSRRMFSAQRLCTVSRSASTTSCMRALAGAAFRLEHLKGPIG